MCQTLSLMIQDRVCQPVLEPAYPFPEWAYFELQGLGLLYKRPIQKLMQKTILSTVSVYGLPCLFEYLGLRHCPFFTSEFTMRSIRTMLKVCPVGALKYSEVISGQTRSTDSELSNGLSGAKKFSAKQGNDPTP